MRVGLGHRPDLLDHVEEDLRLRPVTSLIGTSASRANERDWRHLNAEVYQQTPAESCVLHAGTDGLYMGAQGRGEPIPRLSVRYPWALARYIDQRTDGVPVNARKLLNVGVRPRSAIIAMQDHGLITDASMPFDIATINDDIKFGADVRAAEAKLTGHYRIPDRDESELVKLASDRCHFTIVAFDWYQSYAEYTGGEPLDEPRGLFLGRHMVLVVGFRASHILIKNSHGAGWGEAGYAWITDRVVDSHYCRDGQVLTTSPRIAV